MQLDAMEILQMTGGCWVERAPGDLVLTGVSTDSRQLIAGDGFVAIRGERFDGHAFLGQAVEKGAAALVVEEGESEQAAELGIPVLSVPDTLRALGDLARAWRRKCMAQRIAVVGSCGKTTTKEMLARILSERAATHATLGNLNNLIGVPRTLFDLKPSDRYAVLELGMNEAGELKRLTEIVKPDLLLLLNVGDAHVGQFGSIEALRRAKAEAVEALDGDVPVVYDGDSEGSRDIMARYGRGHMRLSFGIDQPADVMASDIRPHPAGGYAFQLVMGSEKIAAHVPIFGRHNILNALAAAAAVHVLGIPGEMIARGLARMEAAPMRSELRRVGPWEFLLDCYNANPSSMRSALESLGEWFECRPSPGRLFLVLGEMLELGDASAAAHVTLAGQAAVLHPEGVFLLGGATRETSAVLREKQVESEWYESADALADACLGRLEPGDVVFFKGSRSNRLEAVVEKLEHAAFEKMSNANVSRDGD